MGLIDKLKSLFPDAKTSRLGPDVIEIDVPKSLYVKELAVYAATSLIANAISQSEIKVYENGKSVRNEDYFSLNIKPNPNQSASEFWHKVAEKALKAEPGKGALCFIHKHNLYCADDYIIEQKRPFLGNIYSGVVVDDFQLSRKFTADQVFIFKLENAEAYQMINAWHQEYGACVAKAMEAYKDTNVKKYKFKVAGVQAGDAQFAKDFEEILKEPLKKFTDGDAKIYVEYDGKVLEEMDSKSSPKTSDDTIKLLEETFKVVGKVYKVPESLMLGNITNMNDVVKAFLTFAVDPYADMIGKELTGQYGCREWLKGSYYKVDTSTVSHIDIFDMADSIDKLISSSFACVDEVRERAGLDAIGEEWSSKHLLTKNYEFMERMLKEGGEDSGRKRKNQDTDGSESQDAD